MFIKGLLMQSGKLITNGVHLQTHEFHTVNVLIHNGFNVELIPPSQIPGVHLPDIMLNNLPREIKAPDGGSRNTIRHNLQNALRQSSNIIIDLFRCKLTDDKAIAEIKHQFLFVKAIKRIIIIKKNEEIIDLSR